MSTEMTWEQSDALRKMFPPNVIGQLPKGGTTLSYVGHAAVTDRLLSIDPGWTWEPMAVDVNGLPAYQNGCLWIRLTVCGVTRLGVGDGPDPKQRISDAIRNAAMRFGVALDLWTKDELEGDPTAKGWTQTHHDTAAPKPERPRETVIDKVQAAKAAVEPVEEPLSLVVPDEIAAGIVERARTTDKKVLRQLFSEAAKAGVMTVVVDGRTVNEWIMEAVDVATSP